MSNASVVKKQRNQNSMTPFSVVERHVPCPHKFQFYVDYGTTNAGPWIKVGVNSNEFGVGYLPRSKPTTTHLTIATPTAI
jgi:hypothetical protein